jgi:hypothetical protein
MFNVPMFFGVMYKVVRSDVVCGSDAVATSTGVGRPRRRYGDILPTTENRRCVNDHAGRSFSMDRDLVMSMVCQGEKVVEEGFWHCL